jgi:DNA-binding MarR family transcriptional regulator
MKADDLGGLDRQLRRGVVPEGWLPDLEGSDSSTILIILWAGRLSRRVEAFYQEALRSYGLKYSDYAVLCLLHFLGPMSPKRLNLQLAITSGGLTKSIQRLEEKKFVRRDPIPEDGRGTLVSLTKKGARTVPRILAEDVRALDDLLGDRTSADRRRIASALRDLLDAYERDQ